MGEQVKVADIETIERFRAAYASAVESFGLALQDAENDVQRTGLWLDNEMTSYWQRELRKGQDQVVICKSALFRKQEIKSTPEARPSVVSEKKALDKAKKRVALCEEKLQRVRFWKNELPRQEIVFKGALAPMATMLDRDAPRILAMLRHMTEHLEEYLRSSPDETERLLGILGEVSVKRSGEEAAAEEEPAEPQVPDEEEPS
jgi:hypothetical protein